MSVNQNMMRMDCGTFNETMHHWCWLPPLELCWKSIGLFPLIFPDSLIKYYFLTWVGKRIKYCCCVVCLLLWFEIEIIRWSERQKLSSKAFALLQLSQIQKAICSTEFIWIHCWSRPGCLCAVAIFKKLFPLQQLSSYSWYFECPGCVQTTIQKYWNIKCPILSRTRVLIY